MENYLIGKRFGKLTVLAQASNSLTGLERWYCKCKCGNIVAVSTGALLSGRRTSCGCLNQGSEQYQNRTLERKIIHHTWQTMLEFCEGIENKFRPGWTNGIIVCDEWNDEFDNFYMWSLENGFRKTAKLFRLDTSKDYEPANCYWQQDRGEQLCWK